jgi:hypothetical protein
MTNSNFFDPEKAYELHTQKLEAMKTLMGKIVDNPESVKMSDLQNVINFSDQVTTNNVTDQ